MAKFSIPLEALAKKTGKSTETVLRHSMLALFQRIDYRSPVDSGRFRGSWQCAAGAMPTGTTADVDSYKKALSVPLGGVISPHKSGTGFTCA